MFLFYLFTFAFNGFFFFFLRKLKLGTRQKSYLKAKSSAIKILEYKSYAKTSPRPSFIYKFTLI